MKINNAKLKFLNINEIEPSGWIKKQLEIQKNGLSGNLDLFWPDVKDSSWFGGNAEGWERAPYWLDGIIPLAYLLKDKPLIKRIEKYINYIVDNQRPDGWLGPKKMNVENVEMIFSSDGKYDIWAQFLALKVLIQYHDITKEERVFEAIRKGLYSIDNSINYTPLFNWGQARWFEALIPIFWYYEKTGDEWVYDLAIKLRGQGFEWGEFIKYWPYKKPTEKEKWNYMSHVVNNAMAIKSYGLWYRISKDKKDLNMSHFMINELDKYHGTVFGGITGDECLAGTSPVRGTELCSIVEYMYSLEQLISNTGDISFADRLELLAFNALPATISEDMWSHQYDQQVNQIECSTKREWPWNTNDMDANIFGLQPHFGCCTSNMHQGWPKFVSSLWMKDEKENLIVISYSPCKINTKVLNTNLMIHVDTDYPFKNKVKIKIKKDNSKEISLFLRNVSWSKETKITIGSEVIIFKEDLLEIKLIDNESEINIEFEEEFEILERNNTNFSIKRGPLLYSLKIPALWKQINKDDPLKQIPHGDWELYPLENWNYSFKKNAPKKIIKSIITDIPFSEKFPPISIQVEGYQIPNWVEKNGCADILNNPKLGDKKLLKLIPYGCSKLRITEFPKI